MQFKGFHLRFGLSIVAMLFLIQLSSCRRQTSHSELFDEIVTDAKSGVFHGVELGEPLENVLKKEKRPPKHDDQWGYLFEYSLGEKKKYFLEYVCKNPKVRKVNAIVLNVYLEEKGEAAKLFTEFEMHLRQLYGAADGSLGKLTWDQEEANLTVALRMLDDKKSFSLNYVPILPM